MPTRYYHSRYRLFLLTLFLLFFFTSPLAQACELWYEDDGIYKGYRGNCSLAELLQGYDLAVELTPPPPPPFKLPNLQIRKFKSFVQGASVQLEVDVRNVGTGDARPFTVTAMVSVMSPQSGMVGNSQAFAATVSGLAAGAASRLFLGVVPLPDRDQDYDLVLIGYVDPPSGSLPLGEVFEANESDNQENDVCRVYGPEPDVSTPPCD